MFMSLKARNNQHPVSGANTKPVTSYMVISCIVVFVTSLAVLWWNAAPSITFHDSSEFAIAAVSAGIPHPPGAPTYTSLASLWVRLGAFTDPARGTNLFSGLMGAITVALLCLLVQLWSNKLCPNVGKRNVVIAGICSAAILMKSTAFLEQSFVTEQYTLLTALLSAMLVVSTLVIFAKDEHYKLSINRSRYVVLGLLWGLAIGNHLSQICLVFLVFGVLLSSAPKGCRISGLLQIISGLFVGLLIFLYVPIRSHANPLIDFGNVKSLHQFIWAIERKAWHSRTLSSAPPDFTIEWLKSYALNIQVGTAALAFAVVGMVYAIRKHHVYLLMLIAVSIPYAAGMIYGHLKQAGMGVSYVKSYGVIDWHLPEYMAIAALSGVGLTAISNYLRSRKFIIVAESLPVLLLVFLIAMCCQSVSAASLRHFKAPDNYLNALTRRIPKQAVVLASEDNAVGALTYWSYISHPDHNRLIMLKTTSFEKQINNRHILTQQGKVKYLTIDNMDPLLQVFRISLPNRHQIEDSPLYIDFSPGFLNEAKYLLPDGMLFKVAGRETSNNEVMDAEARWRKENPELLRRPTKTSHRLERHAWAVLHRDRGAFFTQRQLWKQSADCYTRALEWVPDDGEVWYCLAYALDQDNQLKKAAVAYQQAISLVPHMKGARTNLAIIYLKNNDKAKAVKLLTEELKIDPKNMRVRSFRDRLAK